MSRPYEVDLTKSARRVAEQLPIEVSVGAFEFIVDPLADKPAEWQLPGPTCSTPLSHSGRTSPQNAFSNAYVIGQIRTTVFGLQPQPIPHEQSAGGVRQQVLGVVQDATGPLGFPPSLRFHGSLELITRP